MIIGNSNPLTRAHDTTKSCSLFPEIQSLTSIKGLEQLMQWYFGVFLPSLSRAISIVKTLTIFLHGHLILEPKMLFALS